MWLAKVPSIQVAPVSSWEGFQSGSRPLPGETLKVAPPNSRRRGARATSPFWPSRATAVAVAIIFMKESPALPNVGEGGRAACWVAVACGAEVGVAATAGAAGVEVACAPPGGCCAGGAVEGFEEKAFTTGPATSMATKSRMMAGKTSWVQ